jgi:hypothetical protein
MIDPQETMRREKCDRCNKPTNGVTTMSIFNQEVICIPCKEAEKKETGYKEAVEADLAAIRKGDYNFPGIGRKTQLPH